MGQWSWCSERTSSAAVVLTGAFIELPSHVTSVCVCNIGGRTPSVDTPNKWKPTIVSQLHKLNLLPSLPSEHCPRGFSTNISYAYLSPMSYPSVRLIVVHFFAYPPVFCATCMLPFPPHVIFQITRLMLLRVTYFSPCSVFWSLQIMSFPHGTRLFLLPHTISDTIFFNNSLIFIFFERSRWIGIFTYRVFHDFRA